MLVYLRRESFEVVLLELEVVEEPVNFLVDKVGVEDSFFNDHREDGVHLFAVSSSFESWCLLWCG